MKRLRTRQVFSHFLLAASDEKPSNVQWVSRANTFLRCSFVQLAGEFSLVRICHKKMTKESSGCFMTCVADESPKKTRIGRSRMFRSIGFINVNHQELFESRHEPPAILTFSLKVATTTTLISSFNARLITSNHQPLFLQSRFT